MDGILNVGFHEGRCDTPPSHHIVREQSGN